MAGRGQAFINLKGFSQCDVSQDKGRRVKNAASLLSYPQLSPASASFGRGRVSI